MEKTRILNEEEKCELISALANAKNNNRRKAKVFKAAEEDAHHRPDADDLAAAVELCNLAATAERCEMWAQLDEALIEAIRDGRLFILAEDEEE